MVATNTAPEARRRRGKATEGLVKVSFRVPLELRKSLRNFATDAERDMEEVGADAIREYLAKKGRPRHEPARA